MQKEYADDNRIFDSIDYTVSDGNNLVYVNSYNICNHNSHFVFVHNCNLFIELVSDKHMAIVGYGDIGAACAKVAKVGFGMKVSGVKRDVNSVPEQHREYCDEIVGED